MLNLTSPLSAPQTHYGGGRHKMQGAGQYPETGPMCDPACDLELDIDPELNMSERHAMWKARQDNISTDKTQNMCIIYGLYWQLC